MPTPRPTMVATIGAAVLTSMVAASSVMPAEPTARPTRATTIGSPALTTEPKASTRMSSAATMPISSPLPRIGAAAVRCEAEAPAREGSGAAAAPPILPAGAPSPRSQQFRDR